MEVNLVFIQLHVFTIHFLAYEILRRATHCLPSLVFSLIKLIFLSVIYLNFYFVHSYLSLSKVDSQIFSNFFTNKVVFSL